MIKPEEEATAKEFERYCAINDINVKRSDGAFGSSYNNMHSDHLWEGWKLAAKFYNRTERNISDDSVHELQKYISSIEHVEGDDYPVTRTKFEEMITTVNEQIVFSPHEFVMNNISPSVWCDWSDGLNIPAIDVRRDVFFKCKNLLESEITNYRNEQ